MKRISLICFLFLQFACAPSKEKICSKIDDSIRNSMEKAASKSNKDLTIDELKTTSFEMIGAGRIDTLSKAIYTRKASYFLNRYKATGSAAKAYLDSADYYLKLDSLTTLQIANRWQDPQVYYYSKTYINTTIGNVRAKDTMRYALDQTFKLIPIL